MAGAAALVPGFTILSPERQGGERSDRHWFHRHGGRAQAHLDIVNGLKQQGKATPVAVCDVYRPRLEAASKKTGGAKMYMEHEALLADPDVDVVCIATPDRLHAPQTIDAIHAGKDVYCEKPLTHWSQFEMAKKVRGCRQEQGPAGPGRHPAHGRRQLPRDHPADPQRDHRQAHARDVQLLPPGRLGRAHADSRHQCQARPRPDLGTVPGRCSEGALLGSRFFQWRMFWDYAGGPATDLLVHTFTPVFCVLELGYPDRVFGGGGTFEYSREVPDQCNIIADYPGGPSVVMTNSLSNAYPADTVIRGSDGIITWGMLQGGQEYGVRIQPFGAGKKEILLPWKGQGDTSKLWVDFLRCVKTRQQPLCNVAMAVRVQAPLVDGHHLPPREQGREVRWPDADPGHCLSPGRQGGT